MALSKKESRARKRSTKVRRKIEAIWRAGTLAPAPKPEPTMARDGAFEGRVVAIGQTSVDVVRRGDQRVVTLPLSGEGFAKALAPLLFSDVVVQVTITAKEG